MIGPVTAASAVRHMAELPAATDIVVIGAGVAGVSTAYFAAKAGRKVVLIEKGRVAGEQSSRNWGWIRQQGRDPDELTLTIEANRLWREFAEMTSDRIGLRRTGTAYLMRKPSDEELYEAWLPHAKAHGLDTRMITKAALEEMMPGAAAPWNGALWTPSDMRAEPWIAVPALARLAARAGVAIRENCAARMLDVSAGRVSGVVTEAGTVKADAVVLAGGAWSRLFLGMHGITIPQLAVRASVCATEALPEVFSGCAADDLLAFRRRVDGGYNLAPSGAHDLYIGPDVLKSLPFFLTLLREDPFGTGVLPAAPRGYPDAWTTPRQTTGGRSPFEAMRVLDPPANPRSVGRTVRRFQNAFPGLPEVRVKRAWGGMIDTMPDVVPVIDTAGTLPGLTVLTGLSGHGFGIGPGVGRAAANLALGNETGHDLSRFRLSRFADGTRLRPGPHL